MNILLFDATKFWSGGAERVYFCCEEFMKKRHSVVLVCLPTSRLNFLLKNKIKIYNIHPVFDLDFFAAIKIFFVVIKHKIHVIDIHSPKFYWLGTFVGKVLNKKVFITRNVEYRKKGIKRIINKFLYNFLCNGVIVVSNKVKQQMMKDFEIKNERIKLIYDGFFFKLKGKNLRTMYNIPQHAILFAIIGRIEENKRQKLAVEVVKKLIEKKYDVYLFIVGPIEEKDYYKTLVKLVDDLQLRNKVIFTGFVSNIEDYIFSSDIIISCSQYESMGKAILESVVMNKPVITTTSVKVEELSKDLLKFINYAEPNVESFVLVAEQVIKNIEFYKTQSVSFDIQKFSYENMAEEYLDFYNKFK